MSAVEPVVHLDPASLAGQMADDVRRGLTASPKWLLPKYLYDARGSELFDEITRLPEYYPTRAERSILLEQADAIAAASGARTLVELGSGTSEKTRLLLDALARAGTLERFVPFDVDPAVLADAAEAVSAEHPGVEVAPVVGDFEQHLRLLPRHPARLVAFLGSTIGNLEPPHRARFLADVRATMGPDDSLLLGTDLVKDVGRLEAAYDDAAGVTAAFGLNVLGVLNRELDADFDPAGFRHRALWSPTDEWVELALVSQRDQVVRLGALDLEVSFAAGEAVRTEVSTKFRRERVVAELADAGLRVTEWWTDPDGDFALSLAVPT
ncbi:L-histidine N(alpha)-methyltransferase [uncultured Nocardioides sp.]|uniref:L-histidine N(alpha)-methyltransferase n=1 Tax=uncultured Nocardioides sp. TaxID=198441 RepID=UPI0026235421|nr:L-histidine N(alpha)-methyltransferase [uncultured Nocardioides sp.]